MSDYSSSIYSSERVEALALGLLKKACFLLGLGSFRNELIEGIAKGCEMEMAIKTIAKNLQMRHQGRFGRLDKKSQVELNLKLAEFEIHGNSFDDRVKLIREFVERNDQFNLEKKNREQEQIFLEDIGLQVTKVGHDLGKFLRKVRNLYAIRVSLLRRSVFNNGEFKRAHDEMNRLFSKYVFTAVRLTFDCDV